MAGYIALVHKDEGTSYGVSFPDLPSCISAGDTFEEAVANAAEAIAAHLALMRADGDTIPAPRSFDELKRDREFLADAADAIVTVVQPQRMPATREVGDKRGVRATLRIGHELVCAPKAIPVTSGSARQGRHRYRDRALRPASRTHLLPQSSP
jgi:predicted RNase H-like HicB family nuclease